MTQAKAELKIKIERVTNLNKALLVLNLQNDKRRVEFVTESDLEEIDDIMDTEPDHEPGICPVNTPQSSHDRDSEDVIILGFENRPANTVISVGVQPLEVDEDLSLQYSFTVDVS